jgi:hypothetical protein
MNVIQFILKSKIQIASEFSSYNKKWLTFTLPSSIRVVISSGMGLANTQECVMEFSSAGRALVKSSQVVKSKSVIKCLLSYIYKWRYLT